MTRVITTGNFKGGVGKTTNAVMFSYTLSKMNLKTLLIDFDPQANATDLLLTTKKMFFINLYIFKNPYLMQSNKKI